MLPYQILILDSARCKTQGGPRLRNQSRGPVCGGPWFIHRIRHYQNKTSGFFDAGVLIGVRIWKRTRANWLIKVGTLIWRRNAEQGGDEPRDSTTSLEQTLGWPEVEARLLAIMKGKCESFQSSRVRGMTSKWPLMWKSHFMQNAQSICHWSSLFIFLSSSQIEIGSWDLWGPVLPLFVPLVMSYRAHYYSQISETGVWSHLAFV